MRDNRILADMSIAFLGSTDSEAMVLYVPKEGRFIFALIPFEGAMEGDIRSDRIPFAERE